MEWLARLARPPGVVIFQLEVVSDSLVYGLLASAVFVAGNQILQPLTSRLLVKLTSHVIYTRVCEL